MKRTDAIAIGDLIARVMDDPDTRPTFDRQKASWAWGEVLGPSVVRVTSRRYVEGDVLHAYITSAAIKSELSFMLEPLVEKINQAVGTPVIKKIILH